MKSNQGNNLFQNSNALKVLALLSEQPHKDMLPGEIMKKAGLSRVGVYLALKQLYEQKLITKTQRGRIVTYLSASFNPLVKQYRILTNIRQLMPLLQNLNTLVKKIILFGSASRGEDEETSDMDLFFLTNDYEGVFGMLSKAKTKRKIHAVIKTPSEFEEFNDNNPIFQKEIERGIVLWEEMS
jgi:predicted nucleotidyltransferase